MRIGLDIDGVIYNWEKTARYMLREVLPNSPYNKPDEFRDLGDGLRSVRIAALNQESQSWNYIQDHVRPEHWAWLWNEGVRLGLFRHGHLYSGSIQAIRALAEIGEVVLITHRPKQAVNDTLDWISFQRLPIAGLHLLTNMEPKSSVRPACDVYLDDKPENVVDLYSHTDADVFIMARPWNDRVRYTVPQRPDMSVVNRVRTWPEFVEKVRAL